METRRSKRNAGDKEVTAVQMKVVQKSSRTALASKRLRYSPPLPRAGARHRSKKHNMENIQRKENEDSSHSENSDAEVTNGKGLSAYELERLENIRQNQAFLSSLKLFQASKDLKQSSARRQPSKRGLTRKPAVVKEVVPSRRSLRLQNKQAEVLTLPPEPRETEVVKQTKKPPGPLPMEPVNMAEGSELPPQFLQLCSEVSSRERGVELDLKEYCSLLKKMRISEDQVAKVVKERIFSAAFHPASTSLLMAAGDKYGKVGIWSVGGDWGDDGVLLFEPHTRPVGCLAFSKAHPAQLLSLSYDGSLRCMDVEKGAFDDVYGIEDGLKTFDFLSHDCATLVVGDWYGNVAIVDRRTPGTSHESLHSLDPKVVRCVSVHPLQQQYVAVAESREVSIYDARCLKKTRSQPVSQLQGHSLSISSCYFSPCTGNRVLTSCMDNYVRIYDTSAMMTEAPLLTSIRHDMRTGRWLSKLSAVWDPKQEDCLLVGSMSRPRRVQVFHESGRLLHIFKDNEHLSTVLSVTAFHPTRNAILGGNASGRLHVFSD
ncbi:WD repeat-containing protein 76 [Hippocampus comes]|uniref:WD repeat-containing protein 76 n=1 Tax=Hippocampus comes TaxID=109280 RepID=UPI00094E7334|nr:PREDICTED: WD repeat-containing protein 76 [Hippocampus comes]